MRIYKLKYLLLFLATSIIACSGPKIDVDTDEADYLTQENSVIYYKGEPFNGTLIEYYDQEKTKLSFERKIKEGKDEGISIKYYENGIIDESYQTKDGNRHGKYFGNHENGQLAVEGDYFEDERNGTWTWYHENGNLSGITDYTNGDYTGRRLSFYEDNTPEYEYYYTPEGEKNGEWREFFENGQIKTRSNWNSGIQVGEYYSARSENVLSEKGQYDQNGYRTGTWEDYSYAGKLITIINYKDGEYHGAYTKYMYVNDDDEAVVDEEGSYTDGQRDGEWNEYSIDYDDVLYLNAKSFYEDGNLVRVVRYNSDGSISSDYEYN